MSKPRVLIVAGSKSDMPTVNGSMNILDQLKIAYDMKIASAHRTPKVVMQMAHGAEKKYDVVIALAGGAAHLPGVIAASTPIPVIGVPVETKPLSGFDSLYSIVQMPTGIPVATVAIGGSKNAAILAAQILSVKYPKIRNSIKQLKKKMEKGFKL
ncbi:5-(carboxyamino)imidazole ribonucleotide mutase [Candidatus Margulisiibacteriota bacterium]